MFTGSEQLPKQTNTKYTYITLDFGVTIKEFHVQWSQPEKCNWIMHISEHIGGKFMSIRNVPVRRNAHGHVWRALQ